MSNNPPPGWYLNPQMNEQWWDGTSWGELKHSSVDAASDSSGKIFGSITGLVGGIVIWAVIQAYRVCNITPGLLSGEEATRETLWNSPFDPMEYVGVDGATYSCASVLVGNQTAIAYVLAFVAVGVFFLGGLCPRQDPSIAP